ncbi:hypothetical protein FHR83_001931 [Actinoplanes campanulatus]|uniref:WD40-like Beta Propeller Repeat n=2 Tax=Actinoplanes campanulatus TaxID=113559 RepID=A0A7W5AE32_9ACTN|nr:hypothetical protein [Actinoplanes campanulatus]
MMGVLLMAALTGAPVATAGPAETVCRIEDDRLVEISGLVSDGSGYVVINDSSDDDDRRRIFFLDEDCAVTRTVKYPSDPQDTEDLTRAADGTLWVGDTGDNDKKRESIALWRLDPGSKKPELFRLSYPDGPHDAEALLVGADGVPVIVTKDPLTAGVYVPDGELRADGTTTLRRAGGWGIPIGTGTSNPYGIRGRAVVTGGAVSPDGRRVALRTYADAFEFDVPDGDVVRAITEGTATPVALPDEPQGESIAYSTDGTALLTVSEGKGGVPLTRYPSGLPVPPSPSPSPSPVVDATSPLDRPFPVGAMIAGIAFAGAAVTLFAMRRRHH